jgi:hypothetical protein
VLRAEGAWNDSSEGFAGVTLCCAGCYDEVRERNRWVRATVEPASFTCSACGMVHEGLPYDFGASAPSLDPGELARARLTSDVCELGDDRFVRACLEIPIIGGPGPLVYGVWVSLSVPHFAEFIDHARSVRRYLDGPYFGWFATRWTRSRLIAFCMWARRNRSPWGL